MIAPHYYESHVTIEPIDDTDRMALMSVLCGKYKFRIADLLMKNREKSRLDTFCSSRGPDAAELTNRMTSLVQRLQAHGFEVWRYKIESVIVDSKVAEAPELPLKRPGARVSRAGTSGTV